MCLQLRLFPSELCLAYKLHPTLNDLDEKPKLSQIFVARFVVFTNTSVLAAVHSDAGSSPA